MPYTRNKVLVLAPLTLVGAGAAVTTDAVSCLGAAEVYFLTKATNSVNPSAAVYEYSVDGGVSWIAAQAAYFETQNTVALASNINGALLVVTPITSGIPHLKRMPATHLRAKFTPNVTGGQDTTGFQCHAVVIPS